MGNVFVACIGTEAELDESVPDNDEVVVDKDINVVAVILVSFVDVIVDGEGVELAGVGEVLLFFPFLEAASFSSSLIFKSLEFPSFKT
eukprot:Awhi_evm1s8789